MRLEWKRLGVGGSPEARWGHVTVSLSNGAFLVFGGNGNKTFNDLTLYNSGSNSWSKIEPQGNPPAPRYGHSATPFGQQILIYGGRANSKPFSDVTVLQHQGGDRFKWLKSQHQHKSPEGRAGHTAIAYNNQLIVFGGHNSSRNKYYNSVLTFNIDTGNWDQPTCDGAVPPARGSHSTFQVGNHMYVFGGFDGKKYYNDLHCLDLDKMIWKKIECKGNSPKPRSGHSSTLMGDRLVIFGGCGSDSNFLNDVHLLSLDDMRWEQPVMAGMENPHPRFRHTANSMGQNKVFIYAGTGSGILLSDALVIEASEDQLLTMPSTTTTSTATASNNNATANQSTTSPPPPTTTTTSTTATSIPTSTTTTTTNNPVVITTTGNNNGNGINNTGGTTPPNSSAASIMMTTTSLITTTTTTTTTSSSSSTSPSPSPSPLSSSPPNTSTTTHQSPIQITSDSFQSGFIVQQPQTQQQQHSQPQQQQQQQQQQHSPSHQSSHSHQQQIINISPERPSEKEKEKEKEKSEQKEKKSKLMKPTTSALNTLKLGSEKILSLFEKDNEIKSLKDSLAFEVSQKMLADIRIEKELNEKKRIEDHLNSEKMKFESKRQHLDNLLRNEQKQKQQLEDKVNKLNLSNTQLLEQVGKLTAQFREMEQTLAKKSHSNSRQNDETISQLKKQCLQLSGEDIDDLTLDEYDRLESIHLTALEKIRVKRQQSQARKDDELQRKLEEINLLLRSYVAPEKHRAAIERLETDIDSMSREKSVLKKQLDQLNSANLDGLSIDSLSALEEIHQKGLAKLSILKQEEWKKQLATLKKEKEQLQDQNTCIICTDRQPNVVLLPCRHSSLCSKCSSCLSRCPVCRANIEERLETFN